jgi:hypothetical protein
MLALHVDPSLLTAPLHAASIEEARDLIGRLTEISAVITRDLMSVTTSTDCATVLAIAGAFPAYDSVQNLLQNYNLTNEFSAGDVVRLINNILDRALPAREALDIEAVDLTACTLTPVPWTGAGGPLEDASQRALATVRHANAVRAGDLVAASFWARTTPTQGSIHVHATGDIDSASGVHMTLATPIAGVPPLIRAVDDLPANVNVMDVWTAAVTPRDFHLAIALQAAAVSNTPLSALPVFGVGSAFPESLGAYQAAGGQPYASVTLDVCAHVLLGQPKYQVAPFGQTRTRDSADAMRTHISKGGAALRLMLWEVGGTPEFANVGPKNQLVIQNGDRANSYSGNYSLI